MSRPSAGVLWPRSGGGGGSDPPRFVDDFSVDSRADWTFPSGFNLSGGGSGRAQVSGGHLFGNTADNNWSLLYPTALAVSNNYIIKMKFNISATGQNYTGVCPKIYDGNNYFGYEVDTDAGRFKLFQVSGGTYTDFGGGGAIPRSTDLWLVGGVRSDDRAFGFVYLDDPEVTKAPRLASAIQNVLGGGFNTNPGHPGILIAGNSSSVNVSPIDDFKVWAGGDSPWPF